MDCTPASAKIDLDINNVRAGLLNAGDLWWDLSSACYEIPKGSQKHSIFSGALWFGALDDGGQLLTAAMTYRQTGNDFWAGPLDTTDQTISDTACWVYDRFWKVNRADVEAFTSHFNDPAFTIPEAILSWPGNGNAHWGEAHYLAPFKDLDGDGIYEPRNGDYPDFALNGLPNCNTNLLGDQAIWWVFNDKANPHSETSGNSFGMEVHAMAYAFHTNDVLNDATFYRYQIINRSNTTWNQMWMGQFTDTDLGAFDDDYVGCDVSRGMGYSYNGTIYDGGSAVAAPYTYGEHPPAIGIDFLIGPLADANDLIDNDRDSILDENGERIKMTVFKYYDGDFSILGHPYYDLEYYYYLQGLWLDGSPQTYGGNGYGGSVITKFMFPGNSDPYGWGTGGVPQLPWSELTEGNTPADRRFVESVGPFSMAPGEIETITIGVPWARDTAGDNLDAIVKLQQADDYIQQLFDNCFSMNCSTHADADFSFSSNDASVFFTNSSTDGNYYWNFGDNNTSTQKHPSHTYSGAGTYSVCLRVITACDTQTVCKDVEIVLPVFECGPSIQRLEGQGSGNQVIDFTVESANEIFTAADQRTHFPWYKPLHGPVKITYEDYSALVNGDYRIAFDSVSTTAHWKMWIVGGSDTVYSDSTIAGGDKQFISQWGIAVQVKQIPLPGLSRNPDRNGFLEGTISFSDPAKNWLTGIVDNDYHTSYNWIRAGTFKASNPSPNPCNNAYDDRYSSGTPIDPYEDYESIIGKTWAPYRLTASNHDPGLSMTCNTTGPAYWPNPYMLLTKIDFLANVDVVFTSDKSKWTRCAVIEIGSNSSVNENFQEPMLLRAHASVDKDGRTVAQGGISDVNNPNASDFIGANGMGWFPGYAINIETGERLNICFGENSALTAENGRDMLWNPSSNEKTLLGEPLFGGMQYIYVFGHNGDAVYTSGTLVGQLKDVPMYDNCKMIYTILSSSVALSERTEVYRDAIWTSIPMLNPGHQILESDATVRLRVAKPFAKYNTSSSPLNNDYPLYGFKIDKLNLTCNLYNGDVLVYPNPFNEYCTIIFNNTGNEKFSLRLYDLRGRLVRVYEEIVDDRVVIDGYGLEEGVYIYSLAKEGEKPVTGRIVLR